MVLISTEIDKVIESLQCIHKRSGRLWRLKSLFSDSTFGGPIIFADMTDRR